MYLTYSPREGTRIFLFFLYSTHAYEMNKLISRVSGIKTMLFTCTSAAIIMRRDEKSSRGPLFIIFYTILNDLREKQSQFLRTEYVYFIPYRNMF